MKEPNLMRHCILPGLLSLLSAAASLLPAGELPRAVDERLKVELFAEHPQIVTPTGIDVDHAGRVWAVESNTHFRTATTATRPTACRSSKTSTATTGPKGHRVRRPDPHHERLRPSRL